MRDWLPEKIWWLWLVVSAFRSALNGKQRRARERYLEDGVRWNERRETKFSFYWLYMAHRKWLGGKMGYDSVWLQAHASFCRCVESESDLSGYRTILEIIQRWLNGSVLMTAGPHVIELIRSCFSICQFYSIMSRKGENLGWDGPIHVAVGPSNERVLQVCHITLTQFPMCMCHSLIGRSYCHVYGTVPAKIFSKKRFKKF